MKKSEGNQKETFLVDRDLQDIASYRLQVAIEAALSLCYHVSAKRLKKVPEEYAERFAMLTDAGIIPAELSKRLQSGKVPKPVGPYTGE